MAGVVTSEDQVKLLLAIVKQMGGRIDFDQVARDCNIVSSGAAAKRFSRLQASHKALLEKNDNDGKGSPRGGGTGDRGAPGTPSPKKRKAPAAGGKGQTPKKAKAATVQDEELGASDDEVDHGIIKKESIKAEVHDDLDVGAAGEILGDS